MKKLYTAFLLVLLAALLGVGIYSLADQDAAGSASEKREFVAYRRIPCRQSSSVLPLSVNLAFTTNSPQRKRYDPGDWRWHCYGLWAGPCGLWRTGGI